MRPLPKRARPDQGFCRRGKENRVACARVPALIKAVPVAAYNHCLRERKKEEAAKRLKEEVRHGESVRWRRRRKDKALRNAEGGNVRIFSTFICVVS